MCDSFTCFAIIPMRAFPSFGNEDVTNFGFTISWVMIPLSYLTWTGSMYLTVLLSYQLYSGICREKIVRNKRTYQIMGIVGILSLLTNLPIFWFVNNRGLNCNEELRLILITIPTLVMRLIIPMLALTIFSCLTVRKVYFLTVHALCLIKVLNCKKIFSEYLQNKKGIYKPRFSTTSKNKNTGVSREMIIQK